MKVFVFDIGRCNGCHNCQIACKDEHVGNAWLPYADEQPDTGHFWLKVDSITHGQTPKVKVEYRPQLCNHCDRAFCITAGEGAVYKRDDGLVIIDPEKGKGKRQIVDSCPYGYIYWNEAEQLAQKCTGCAHLVDNGALPHCVDLCATGALRFGEEEEFADEITRAETLVDQSVGPRVYYLNLPKLFAAGQVWDPGSDEIIEGAHLQLTCSDGGVLKQRSDGFGDFWFKRLDAGAYHLSIHADGYESAETDFKLDRSLNLGDFPLKKL